MEVELGHVFELASAWTLHEAFGIVLGKRRSLQSAEDVHNVVTPVGTQLDVNQLVSAIRDDGFWSLLAAAVAYLHKVRISWTCGFYASSLCLLLQYICQRSTAASLGFRRLLHAGAVRCRQVVDGVGPFWLMHRCWCGFHTAASPFHGLLVGNGHEEWVPAWWGSRS